ncbi:hypothetical protein JCM8547_004169 [Rhodosporidiobolus lusitaniae]
MPAAAPPPASPPHTLAAPASTKAAPPLATSTPTLAPHSSNDTHPADGRSQSRSRRLTASLVKLTGGKKDKRMASAALPPTSASDAPLVNGDGGGEMSTGSRRSSSVSRRRSSSEQQRPALSSSPPPATSPHLDQSTSSSSSRHSKPPVSLPSIFRRRNSHTSNSALPPPIALSTDTSSTSTSRRSQDAVRMPSDGSTGSSAPTDDSPSLVSTAPTSPDRSAEVSLSGSGMVDEPISVEERRRRGSDALTQELSQGAAGLEEEDLAAFVAASGSTSVSPTSPNATFAFSPKPPQSVATSSSPPALSPTLPAADETSETAPRRLTRNIEGLSLSSLRVSPNPAPSSNASTASPAALPSSLIPSAVLEARSSTPASNTSSQRARLGALPRLLSATNFSSSYGPPNGNGASESEHEQEESETDTDGESSSDDEGERYETGDEGPVTVRSRDVTPAQTPTAYVAAPRAGRPTTPGGLSIRSGRVPSMTGLAMTGAAPSNWVAFAASTPTPSIRTARPSAAPVDSGNTSYFDLPRPSASGTARTPGLPPQTPLMPMSMSDVARGKRPVLQVDTDAAATVGTVPEEQQDIEGPGEVQDKAQRAGLYRLRSQSVVALASPSMVDSDDEPVGTAAVTGLDPVWQTGGLRTPGPSFLNLTDIATKVQTSPPPPKTPLPVVDLSPPPGSPPPPSQPASPADARTSRPTTATTSRLHRPRSMYELRVAPPEYTAPLYRRPGLDQPQVIQPREEEGNEGLPAYSCAVHIEGFMPRKMEFTAPGVQAKDRAWKRQYVVLHGTSIKIYKFDLRTHPIAGEEDWSVIPAAIVGLEDGPPPLHFHEGEYGVGKDGNANGLGPLHSHKFPLSIGDAKAKAKSRILEGSTAAAQNQLLRHYSLQNAESGLAADYLKRKHVVRVRAEGEQFLLQAKDDRGVIDLIEALQAATNVALDLDARPLPKFITLPRRRRRRRPRPDATAANGTTTAAAGATATAPADTAQPDAPDRMGDMLAEEQNAYARRNSATVM